MFIKDYYTLYSGVYLKRNSIIPLIDIYIYFRPSGFECTPAVATLLTISLIFFGGGVKYSRKNLKTL